MKIFLEVLSGVIIAIVAIIIIRAMSIEMTGLQTGVLVAGILITSGILQEICSAIMKKREAKK